MRWVHCPRCGFVSGFFGKRSPSDTRELTACLSSNGELVLRDMEKLYWPHLECFEATPGTATALTWMAQALNVAGYFPSEILEVASGPHGKRKVKAEPFRWRSSVDDFIKAYKVDEQEAARFGFCRPAGWGPR